MTLILAFQSRAFRPKRKRLLKLFEDGAGSGEDNSKTALKLGEAIRNGDLDDVNKFLGENGVSDTLRLMFSFEIMAARLAVYKEDEGSLPPAMEAVAIRVTSLQLAVLCRQSQLLELLLSSATPSIGMRELNDVLSTR